MVALSKLIKVIPAVLGHGAVMLAQPKLQPDQLSTAQLADIMQLSKEDIQGHEWQLVDKGTTSRWRLQLPKLNKTYFAKTTPPDFVTRLFGALFSLGSNEISFYRDIRPQLELSAPISYGLAGNRYRYLIIIEDLSGRAEFSDLSSRCDLVRAKSVIDTLAKLHGSCWCDSRFERQWQWVNRQQYRRNHAFLTLLREQSSVSAVGKYADLLPDGSVEMSKLVNKAYLQLERLWGQGERTLVHGDAHIGNMYFMADGSTGLLDWQVLGYEQGMRDVSYFMINSLPTELRLEHQYELLMRYTEALQAQGINFSLEQAKQQYVLHASYVWISAAVTAASNTMQEKKIAAAGLIRATKALFDLDVATYLVTLVEE